MKEHNTRGIQKHSESFKGLLKRLGFLNPLLGEKAQKLLYIKVRNRIARLGFQMENTGAITFLDWGMETESICFADWTDTWLDNDWDGSIVEPADWDTVDDDSLIEEPSIPEKVGETCSSPIKPDILAVEEPVQWVEEDEEEYWSEEEEFDEVDEANAVTSDTLEESSNLKAMASLYETPSWQQQSDNSDNTQEAPVTPKRPPRLRVIFTPSRLARFPILTVSHMAGWNMTRTRTKENQLAKKE